MLIKEKLRFRLILLSDATRLYFNIISRFAGYSFDVFHGKKILFKKYTIDEEICESVRYEGKVKMNCKNVLH
jgi:hypothetical protein